MKKFAVSLCIFALCLSGAFALDYEEYRQSFTLLKSVETCELVVVGTVTDKTYVTRGGVFTTDITVSVETVVKGTPNHSNNRVKFMVLGGEGIDPITGERITMGVSGVAKFASGEKALLFLTNSDSDPYYRGRPHGNYHLHREDYGKRKVENDRVNIMYPFEEDRFRIVEMPLDVAVKLSKASEEDRAAATRIEQRIKDMAALSSDEKVALPSDISETLTREAQQIIDDN